MAVAVTALGTPDLSGGQVAPPTDPAIVASNLKKLPGDGDLRVPTADLEAATTAFQADRALAEIKRAQASFPYKLRMPLALPVGSMVKHAEASNDKTAGGDPVHSLDIWFSLPGGSMLHLWQTDAQLTEKNPVTEPGSVATKAADGTVWRQAATEGIKSFSTKFEDGVTMSVDFPVSKVDVLALLSSIAPVAGGIGLS